MELTTEPFPEETRLSLAFDEKTDFNKAGFLTQFANFGVTKPAELIGDSPLESMENIRPLAKLSKSVKIADICNQREAEGEAFSPITIWFREDTKPLDKSYGVFNKDTLLGDFAVLFAFLFGQRTVFGVLFGQERIGVQLSKPLIPSIRPQHDFRFNMNAGILEQLEIMLLSIGKRQRNDLAILKIYQHLCF